MATFNKFNAFVEDLANGVHDLSADQLRVALTNTEPTAGNGVLADITEIDYTNLSSRDITTTSSTQSGGTYSLVLEDLELTASGSVPEFRYAVIYNDTAASDNLIGWYDRGSGIVMENGDTTTLDLTESQTLFDLS